MQELKQTTLSENKEIFEELKGQIKSAKKQIKVVSAWFTDPELFSLLVDKQKSGVEVEVVVSDQKDNNKLPFGDLVSVGGKVRKVKNAGYGMMHQKFCIIDNETLVHGSYNWTINARKNNHESVIITNHQNTVNDMKNLFNRLTSKESEQVKNSSKKGFFNKLGGVFSKKRKVEQFVEPVNDETPETTESILRPITSDVDYRVILDNILQSEIGDFDRQEMKNGGYTRSKLSGGDPGVIMNSLDAVYAQLLNDVSISEGRLNDIKTRIELIRKRTQTQIENQKILRKNSIESVSSLQLNECLAQLEKINVEIDKQKLILEQHKEEKKSIKEKISGLLQAKQSLKKEHIENKPGKTSLWVFGVLGVIALVSSFIFYTSASYILMFSEKDALDATLMGQLPEMPEVFDHLAILKSWDKGWAAVLIMLAIFAFVTILAMSKVFRKKTEKGNSILKNVGIISLILLVDGFLAAKISESVHKVNYMIGNVSEEYQLSSIVTDWNFYKVFLLGAGVLFGLQISASYVKAYFDELKEDKGEVKYQKELVYADEQAELQENRLEDLEKLMNSMNIELVELEGEVGNINRDVQTLKLDRERELQLIEQMTDLKFSELEGYADLLIAKMESGRLPFSMECVRERIAVLFEGWNEFLHEHFASAVATEKLKLADEQKRTWLENRDQEGGTNYFAA